MLEGVRLTMKTGGDGNNGACSEQLLRGDNDDKKVRGDFRKGLAEVECS